MNKKKLTSEKNKNIVSIYTLFIGVMTLGLISFSSNAVTISASKSGQATATVNQSNSGSSPDWRFRLFNSASLNSLKTSKATVTFACTENMSKTFNLVLNPEEKNTNIGTTGGCPNTWVNARKSVYVMTNTSSQPVTSQVSIYNYEDSNDAVSTTITVPGTSSCSVNVNVTADFGKLIPGESVNAINVTTTPTGSGNLKFKPNAFDSNGGKLVKGSDFLTYNITNATWNSSSGEWTSNLRTNDIKLNDIPKKTVSGKYSGNMTVTISCL